MKFKFKIGDMVVAKFIEIDDSNSIMLDMYNPDTKYYGTIIDIEPNLKFPYIVHVVIDGNINTPFREEELTLIEDPNSLLKGLL